jgi:hypothetical protein
VLKVQAHKVLQYLHDEEQKKRDEEQRRRDEELKERNYEIERQIQLLKQKRELEKSFLPRVKKVKGNKKELDLEKFKKRYSITQEELDGDRSKLLEKFCQERDLTKFTINSQEDQYSPFVYRKEGEDHVIQLLMQNEKHFRFNSKQEQPEKGNIHF